MPGDGSLGAASYLFWQQSTQPGCVSFYLCKHQKGSLPAHKSSDATLSGFSHSLLSQIASRVFSLLTPLLYLLIGLLPQLVFNHLRRPFGGMQQVAQALGSRLSPGPGRAE